VAPRLTPLTLQTPIQVSFYDDSIPQSTIDVLAWSEELNLSKTFASFLSCSVQRQLLLESWVVLGFACAY
jgi:hypothetical protein